MVTYKITNLDLFNKTVVDVDTTGLRGDSSPARGLYFLGTLSVETDKGYRDYTGEHGSHDYTDDYGFILEIQTVL